MNVFILAIDGDRESYTNALDRAPMVRNWLAFLPTTIAVVSNWTLGELSWYLRGALPSRQFILTPTNASTSAGLLPSNVWDFINYPRDSGKYPSIPYPSTPSYADGSYNSPLSGLPPIEPSSEKNSLKGLLGGSGLKK